MAGARVVRSRPLSIPASIGQAEGQVTPEENRARSRHLAYAEPAMPRWVKSLVIATVLGCLVPLAGRAAAEVRPRVELPYEKYQLKNGLEVILHQDRTLPLVAVNVWYHVGPANEPRGRSGFAHLFEHLMFEGSRHVGRRMDHLLESAGATNSNGTTSWDRTCYFETVPRQHLQLALWIESDRMGFLSEAFVPERFGVQRDVVKNERRQTYENAPYGPSELALYQTLFPEHHPYRGAVIGSMTDLDAATLVDVAAFYDAYYAPSNATLAVAGDFDRAEVIAQIDKYFGTLRTRARPPRGKVSTPPLVGQRRVVVDEPVDLARVTLGWITPPAYTPDDTALDLVSLILAGGKATRLYRRLVVEEQVAVDVSASMDSAELAGIFTVSATVASSQRPERVEQAIDGVLGDLAQHGPDAGELARARRRLLVDLFQTLQLLNGPGGESGRAGILQRFNHYLGNPGFLDSYLERVVRLSPADIKEAVLRLLGPRARAVIVTRPQQSGGARQP
jgi:zinc protease